MSHWIEQERVIAVVRMNDLSGAVDLASALAEGGVTGVEFTYTNPEASRAIEEVRKRLGGVCHIGAGTILDPETARVAILSGAEFLVTPTLSLPMIQLARRYGVTTVIGAFTPTEMLTAWEAGADYIKVNPASLAGPSYFKDVLAPLPQLKLIPSGGVNLETAPKFMEAGAVAVAAGGSLVGRGDFSSDELSSITERAKAFVEAVGGTATP